MLFNLDTENYETLRLVLTDEELEQSDKELAEKFSTAISTFFTVFAFNLGYDSDNAAGLKNACVKCISETLDAVLEEGVIEVLETSLENPDDEE